MQPTLLATRQRRHSRDLQNLEADTDTGGKNEQPRRRALTRMSTCVHALIHSFAAGAVDRKSPSVRTAST